MRAQEIQARVRTRPFVPIRLFVSDGTRYDVLPPEFILITLREVVIGTLKQGENMPGNIVYFDPIHITRIEPINGKRGHAKARKSR
jgi:hypothetical protein